MKKKVMSIILCAVFLVFGSFMATLAYLTSTDTVENVFTVGAVDISLDEADVNDLGQKLNMDGEVYVEDDDILAERVQTNDYKLIPGHYYVKDPTVHVDGNSVDCYVFITVKNDISTIESADFDNIEKQMSDNDWELLEKDDGSSVTYDSLNVYVYEGLDGSNIVSTSGTNIDLKVFDSFTIDDDVTEDILEYYAPVKDDDGNETYKTVTVTGYAVQADGFDTALDAWEATFGVD